MPRTGGEADKLGNRYEGLWTVDAVLDLLDGDYTELVVEPIGEEADGIEFMATTASGEREYHSIKRQQSDGNWTVSRLAKTARSGRSILGDLVAKATPGATVMFVRRFSEERSAERRALGPIPRRHCSLV